MTASLTPYRLRICMLGSFELEVNGKAVPTTAWKSKKALTLFRYLAARRGEKIPKDKLIDMLWPETEFHVSMEQNLHTCVYFARRVIEPDIKPYGPSEFLVYSNGLYWLEQGNACWIDSEEFEGFYIAGKRLQQSEQAQAMDAYMEALGLYKGDFLAEEPYLDWATDAREYYREMYIDVTLRLATLLAATGDVSEAVRVCRNALRRDPYREDLYYAIMGHLIEAGRHNEATTQYQAYAQMMKNEFGLEPSREARALYSMTQHSGQSLSAAMHDGEASDGAFICHREIFESICHLESRRRDRDAQTVAKMMVSLTGPGVKEHGDRYLQIVAGALRKGDVVSQWEPDKIAICLWNTEETGAKVVSRRIKTDIEKTKRVRVSINYEILQGEDKGLAGRRRTMRTSTR